MTLTDFRRSTIGTISLIAGAALANPLSAQAGRTLLAVSNKASHNITIIDASALRVLRTIAVPYRPRGIEFTPDGKTLLVAICDDIPTVKSAGDAILAIDPARGQITARYEAGTNPERFALSPDGKRIYASN